MIDSIENTWAFHARRIATAARKVAEDPVSSEELTEILSPTVDPADVGSVSSLGGSLVGYALADHVHRHGLQAPSPFMHPPVNATFDGFMSVADKIILDALAAAPPVHTLDAHDPAAGPVNFAQQQALGLCIEVIAGDPASPVPGQIWLNSLL